MKTASAPCRSGLNAFQDEYFTDFALSFAGINITAVPVIIVYIMFQRNLDRRHYRRLNQVMRQMLASQHVEKDILIDHGHIHNPISFSS